MTYTQLGHMFKSIALRARAILEPDVKVRARLEYEAALWAMAASVPS